MTDETITKEPKIDPPAEETDGTVTPQDHIGTGGTMSPQDHIGTGGVPAAEPLEPTPVNG